MGQYFSNDPNVKSNPRVITFTLNGRQFDFYSDNGVFSKDKIDEGSIVLLKVLLQQEALSGNILDLGSGYGTIGLTLASFYKEAKFLLADVNSRACDLARLNIKNMNISNAEVIESDIFSSIKDKTFDCIITNPPIRAGKHVIYEMFRESYEHLAPYGKLYIVIRKNQGAETASNYIQSVFSNVTRIGRDKGYHVYLAIKEESVKANTETKEDLQ